MVISERYAMKYLSFLVLILIGCSADEPYLLKDIKGSVLDETISSNIVLDDYPVQVYLPPGYNETPNLLPVIYVLDSPPRFEIVVDIIEELRIDAIVVGIGNIEMRGRGYMPENTCREDGGGQVKFHEFISIELIPHIDSNFKSNTTARVLIGHSFGAGFALYALFFEQINDSYFSSFISSDPSIVCAPVFYNSLLEIDPNELKNSSVKLYMAKSSDNTQYISEWVANTKTINYDWLLFNFVEIGGSHNGIVNSSFIEGLQFIFDL